MTNGKAIEVLTRNALDDRTSQEFEEALKIAIKNLDKSIPKPFTTHTVDEFEFFDCPTCNASNLYKVRGVVTSRQNLCRHCGQLLLEE